MHSAAWAKTVLRIALLASMLPVGIMVDLSVMMLRKFCSVSPRAALVTSVGLSLGMWCLTCIRLAVWCLHFIFDVRVFYTVEIHFSNGFVSNLLQWWKCCNALVALSGLLVSQFLMMLLHHPWCAFIGATLTFLAHRHLHLLREVWWEQLATTT